MGCRTYLSRHRLDLAVAVTLAVALFAGSWYRHATFRSSAYDLAVFEQVVWKMAHGHGATSTLTAWNTFADHLSPILLVFVPLYRLAASPLWFFAAQAVGMAVAVLAVRPLAQTVGLKLPAAAFLVAAFALHPSIWNGSLYDFHPTTLAVPILLLGCHAALRQRHLHVLLALGGLVFLRDDLALAGAAMTCIGWTADSRDGRIRRAAMIAGALAWTVFGSQLGTAMGATRHFDERYGYLGSSLTDAALHPLRAVVGLAQHVFIGDNAFMLLALLLPVAFTALRKPGWALAALFVALPALAADDTNFHSPYFHYGAPVVPFVILAAAGGIQKMQDVWTLRRLATIAAPLTGAAFLLIGPAVTGSLTRAALPGDDARAALAMVKPDDRVVAGSTLAPHLAMRETLLPFPFPFADTTVSFPLDDRVTTTSPAARDRIDVIVASNAGGRSEELVAELAEDPEIVREFTRTDFGTVTVFRRKT